MDFGLPTGHEGPSDENNELKNPSQSIYKKPTIKNAFRLLKSISG
jgi:hypothetical protein